MAIIDNIQYPLPGTVSTSRKNRKQQLLGAILGSVLVFIVIFIFVDPTGPVMVRFNGALFVTLPIAIVSIYMSFKSRPGYLHRFCSANNGIFQAIYFMPQSPGVLWDIVRNSTSSEAIDAREDFSQEAVNALVRSDGKLPTFYLGRLRDASSYGGYLFITIDLPKDTPHFMIDFDKNATALSPASMKAKLGPSQRYDLEGEFADMFTVYATSPDAARYATYVLTPDVMAKIIDITPQADFEFHGRRLVVLLRPTASKDNWEMMLRDLFTTLNEVVDVLTTRVGAYIDYSGDVSQRLQFTAGGKMYYGVQQAVASQNDVAFVVSLVKNKGAWLTLIISIAILFAVIVVEVLLFM